MADAPTFDAFYLGTRSRLLRQVYALTGDAQEAQDVVQEAYARAWQHWRKVETYEDPEGWLRTVAWRIATNRWRKARNAIAAQRRHGPLPDAAEPSANTVAVVTALRQIPEAQRRALVLHHIAGLSVESVAAETGAPVGTVKARLARGRRALAELLGESGDQL